MASNLLAYCGLYCGACSFKVAYEENRREHLQQMPARYDKLKDMVLEDCPGCRLENQCGNCAMRDCAREKELDHCAQCDEFPCDHVTQFNNDGAPHHGEVIENLKQLRELGEEQWLEAQKKKWTCECGSPYSWYLRACLRCGRAREEGLE